jgi:hypothetical protein
MLAFHIGDSDSEYCQVTIVRDNGDGWFRATISIDVGAFRGTYPADFNSWAFADFLQELQELSQTLSGSASFSSYEEQLELTMTGDSKGHIEVRGEAMDYAGTGNRLMFRLGIDQTYLSTIIRDLQRALDKYPPRRC